LQSTARTGSFKFYFDPLFDYLFGGIEVPNMRALMDLISNEYDDITPTKSPEELVDWNEEIAYRAGATSPQWRSSARYDTGVGQSAS